MPETSTGTRELAAARERLALRQASLLSALVAGAPAPEGFDQARLRVQARALAAKRADVIAKIAAELPHIIGAEYREEFLTLRRRAPAHRRLPAGRADLRPAAPRRRQAGRPPCSARATALVAAAFGAGLAPITTAAAAGPHRARTGAALMVVIAAIGATAIVGTTLWLLAARLSGRASAPRTTPGWTPQSVLDAAFLVGGPSRVVDTVISTMHEDERVRVVPHGRLQVLRPVAANGIEAAVLAACGPEWQADLEEVRASAMRSPAVQEIGDGLAAHGVLYRPDSIRNWRLAARAQRTTCFLTGFALIGTTIITVIVGQASGPGGMPGMFSVFPVFFAVIVASIIGQALAPHGRLAKAGKNAVAQLRRRNPWVPEGTAAWGPAVPALVAIGGVVVLTPGPLRDELMASVAGAGRSFGGSGSSSSDSSASDPGGAAWCGSSSGGCGGSSGCGASSCSSGSSGGGGSSCGGGGGGCGGGGSGGG